VSAPSAASGVAARREAMIAAILARLAGCRTIAVGSTSPLPGTAALLARAKWGARVLMLGSRRHNAFTDGGRELFDFAAQGRLDAFFLSGGQIDGSGAVNLLGIGDYPRLAQRFPGSFGSAYLAFLVPNLILFREEHTPRTLVAKVDFVSAPGSSPAGVFRPGGPVALVTGRCVFSFYRARGRFALAGLHPGEDAAGVRAATGFDYDAPATVATTPPLDAADRALLAGRVAAELAETYPRFAAELAA
jgi:glutaconate CoA-transferase subunit B